MPRWTKIALLLTVLLAVLQWIESRPPQLEGPANDGDTVETFAADGGADAGRYAAFLPPEAVVTLEQIKRGGPFPYERDGSVFQNRERRLPDRPRGYYREYTVVTPGSSDRGARRIVAGGQPPEVYYYTDDHYRSFRRLEIGR